MEIQDDKGPHWFVWKNPGKYPNEQAKGSLWPLDPCSTSPGDTNMERLEGTDMKSLNLKQLK